MTDFVSTYAPFQFHTLYAPQLKRETVDFSGTGGLRALSILAGAADNTVTESLNLSACHILEAVVLAGMAAVTELLIANCPALSSLSFSDLDAVETFNVSGSALTALDVDGLTTLANLDVTGCTALATLSADDCTALEYVTLTGCTALTTINAVDAGMPVLLVDSILAQLDAIGAEDGTVDLSGTNGIPSAAGLESVEALEGKGWTVTVAEEE